MPHFGPAMDGKNDLFQRLKPPCVALGQAAVALHGSKGNAQTAVNQLERVKYLLSSAASRKARLLDAKLADYVFFPIAQLLKVSQRLSIQCLELSMQCIAILIDQGWRQDVPAKLAAQIVILCSLLGEHKPKGLSFSESTTELQTSSFWCLYHLFSVSGNNAETRKLLTNEANFPQLGQTISVILDGIHDRGSVEVQIAAACALETLVVNSLDREIQASFLPGMVSKLTRVLTPQTKSRRNHQILVRCLSLLGTLFSNTLGESATPGMTDERSNGHPNKTIIDSDWQENAAAQLKPALSNILRLKAHSRDDVKESVAQLCLILLQYCRKSLPNCSYIALEALVTMSAGNLEKATTVGIGLLLRADTSIVGLLQSLIHDWLQSLTTIMTGADEQAKLAKMQHIQTAYQLLAETGTDMSTLDRLLAHTLRDSVVITLKVPMPIERATAFATPIQSLDLSVTNGDKGVHEFKPALVQYKGQEEVMRSLENFAQLITYSQSSASFAADLSRSLRQSDGEMQIANFWLLLTATRTALQREHDIDDLLDFQDGSPSVYNGYLEEIYHFSLSILSASSEAPQSPRLQALALRGLALRAQIAGREFRYELMDALYPVLHTLATPDEQLQRDSVTTLNIFTSACGYETVKDLIVENVDYLTNAVALKLNAFDVSPQAPQVLLMMVRLAGPSLLPYLEDTVESIFAALEDYHGYPLLVELLFKVLGVMAEEGAKAPQLAITNGNFHGDIEARVETWEPTKIHDLVTLLRQRAEDEENLQGVSTASREPHPKVPWKDTEEEEEGHESAEEDAEGQLDHAEPSPPAPKTYSLLFKITELTQHFLPSASAPLRTSLLTLIKTTVPAIAQHENSFLPLINTLWPEVVSRLEDEEPYIVAAALEVIQILSQYAGDFMRTRIVQLWPRLVEIYHGTSRAIMHLHAGQHKSSMGSRNEAQAVVANSVRLKQAVSLVQNASSNYGDTSNRTLWLTLVGTLKILAQHIQMEPEMLDEALEMVQPVLGQTDISSAFEKANFDAVWLAKLNNGIILNLEAPPLPDRQQWHFAEIPG